MTRYHVGIKVSTIHYYEIDASSKDDAIENWRDGQYLEQADEVIDIYGPCVIEEIALDGQTLDVIELPI